MKRFRAFFRTRVLIFCTACSTVQNSPTDASHGESEGNTEFVTKSTESEEINEAEIAQQAYDLVENAESLCKLDAKKRICITSSANPFESLAVQAVQGPHLRIE